jgi:hypothetical protein
MVSVPQILGLLLAGCGGGGTTPTTPITINYVGFGCDPGGAHFDLTTTLETPLRLAVGESMIVTATLDGPERSCGFFPPTFRRLEWIADLVAQGPRIQARLSGPASGSR